ncbi:nicotinate phosphoribosyltransferase [Desulfurococcus amylolyticus]|uniref:nicotinate phosphoribosyltransferase n=1 Tax=Desulfurococcus amylolyticus DSM 16532 TaxID=768672 RepID=I3XSD5_DESAM|nr:nicotinate phosphoribosyltransferase [Desulfurococcus amylolyticus]AFL66859.1 Nicotinate phosphoribosyltransferase [Desulfurococcus amylolyticus DSM 16532]
MRFYIACENEILDGSATDVYFTRTYKILKAKGVRKKVRMEFHVMRLPKGYEWAVYAGLEEVLYLLKDKPVTVYSMPEGTLFKAGEPLLIIEGYYDDFALYETAVLGILRHYSSIASKAARIKRLAMDKTILFFGLRAVHPVIAPMVDRAAYIGGADAVSGVLSEKYLGIKPSGTMPHALILVFGDQREAWKAFDDVVEPSVPRIMLVDTLFDEREEALMAAKLLGDRLYGVRLDTPSSRRGDMRQIVEEVRWTLDVNGFKHVKIVVSGGLDEKEIVRLRDIVNAFGVGTSISMPPSVDISADIVEVYDNDAWRPFTKRGKLPGAKQVFRKRPGLNDIVTLMENPGEIPSGYTPLLIKYIDNGELVRKPPTIEDIRRYVIEQLREVPEPSLE